MPVSQEIIARANRGASTLYPTRPVVEDLIIVEEPAPTVPRERVYEAIDAFTSGDPSGARGAIYLVPNLLDEPVEKIRADFTERGYSFTPDQIFTAAREFDTWAKDPQNKAAFPYLDNIVIPVQEMVAVAPRPKRQRPPTAPAPLFPPPPPLSLTARRPERRSIAERKTLSVF